MLARSLRLAFWSLSALALVSPLPAAEIDPLDWPNWRGPEQNGISRETGLVDSWDPEGENLLWKRTDIGSISTPIVLRGKVYLLSRYEPGTTREGERVVCVDAATGKTIWEHHFNVYLSDVPDTRVAWSCVTGDPETGRIYAQGVCGLFLCLDGETGEVVWSRSLSEEFGLLSTYGGRTNVPVVFEDMVIISAVMTGWGEMARPAHRVLALDKSNGQVVWLNGTRPLPEDTTYSTPVVAVLGGQAALVFGSGDGAVYAMQPRTGKIIWKFQASRRGISVSPAVVGDTVYIGHGEENIVGNTMGALLAIDGSLSGDITEKGKLWMIEEITVGKSSPLVVDDKVYVIDDTAGLWVVDAKTGEPVGRKQKLGTMQRSSPVFADGKIYTCDVNGRWNILKPSAKGVDVVQRLRLPEGEEIQGSPIVSHGRVYLNTTGALYCIGTADQKPQATPAPAPAVEKPKGDEPAAQVQIVPAEVLMKPGETVALRVRTFNARGQLIGESPAKFELAGPGEIDTQGNYTAASAPAHTGTIVTASVGELKGMARIRVVPQLPWKFDFENGVVPVTWIGARYRHITIDEDFFRKVRQESDLAGKLYIQLMTEFTNSGAPKATFEDRTPRKTWSVLLRYLGLIDSVGSLADAQKALDPALEILKREGVISSYTWTDKPSAELTVERGPRKFEGNVVALKINTIPKGTRSQGWMGPTDLHDYTIQADVCGLTRNGKIPDMAVIGQRYTLDLMGASQQLQVRSWTAQLDARFCENVPFKWQPDTWYTLKFRAAVEDGKAVLRGKVWKRDEAEPKAWLIEAADAVPNVVGSPGLFGNANDAEILIDNVTITPNS
jgi:outer membrane protein assembly factor BamB